MGFPGTSASAPLPQSSLIAKRGPRPPRRVRCARWMLASARGSSVRSCWQASVRASRRHVPGAGADDACSAVDLAGAAVRTGSDIPPHAESRAARRLAAKSLRRRRFRSRVVRHGEICTLVPSHRLPSSLQTAQTLRHVWQVTVLDEPWVSGLLRPPRLAERHA